MHYNVESHISGFPGFEKPRGAIAVWGFSPHLTPADTAMIHRLLAPAEGNPMILAVKSRSDVLQDWRATPPIGASLQLDSINQTQDWFLMSTNRSSPEFYKRLTEVWPLYYAAAIHIVSASHFWLGYWFRLMSSENARTIQQAYDDPETRAAFRLRCEAGPDGDCLVLETWYGEVPEHRRREIEALVL